MNNTIHSLLLICVMSAGTIFLRFFPFFLLGREKQIPKWVKYLGEVLPGAVLGMLTVYCLRDVAITAAPYGLPELISCGIVVLVQLKFQNIVWSVLAGTAVFMLIMR